MENDYSELQWLRVLAPQAAALEARVSLVQPASGVLPTAAPNNAAARQAVTVQVAMAKPALDSSVSLVVCDVSLHLHTLAKRAVLVAHAPCVAAQH